MISNINTTVKNLKTIYKKAEKLNFKKNMFNQSDKKQIDFFNQNDWLIKKNLIDKKILTRIKKKLNNKLNHKNIYSPKDCSFIGKKEYKKILNYDNKSWHNFPKINNQDIKKGIKFWKKNTSYVIIKDSQKLAPEILKIAKDKKIISILNGYYPNCKFELTFAKVILSFANKILPIDTQLFHNDYDSFRLVKVFLYLDDVLSIQDGPTQFVEDTNVYKDNNCKKLNKLPMRLTEKLIKKNFKNKKLKSFIGKAGDALFLNTGMLHRGKKPKTKNRKVLILSYCIHDEVHSTQKSLFKKN